MPPKSEEDRIKAGAQQIKNTGASESRCVEVGAPASPCSGLEIVKGEFSSSHDKMELSGPFSFIFSHPGSTKLVKWENWHLPLL